MLRNTRSRPLRIHVDLRDGTDCRCLKHWGAGSLYWGEGLRAYVRYSLAVGIPLRAIDALAPEKHWWREIISAVS